VKYIYSYFELTLITQPAFLIPTILLVVLF